MPVKGHTAHACCLRSTSHSLTGATMNSPLKTELQNQLSPSFLGVPQTQASDCLGGGRTGNQRLSVVMLRAVSGVGL